jgi:hypothetical protein
MIELNENERAILAKIELDALALNDHIHVELNGKLSSMLMKALAERRATPEHRRNYFVAPFIHGPDLPPAVIAAFLAEVEACGHVTSYDVVPLRSAARNFVGKAGLAGRDAREFFKLTLDCGLGLSTSLSVRQAVSRA